MLIHARLVALNVAVDDLFVALSFERYRQPGAFNCRDGAIAELWVSDPVSDCECTDASGRGLCNRLRKGSFAAGLLSSSAGLLGWMEAAEVWQRNWASAWSMWTGSGMMGTRGRTTRPH